MKREEVLAFLNQHPIFSLATIEGDTPHVRSMTVYRIEEGKVLFHTDKTRPLCKQLSINPKVELCFASTQPSAEIRVSGSVELVKDEELRKRINSENPETVAVYRLKNGKATAWTKEVDLEPKTYIDL